MKTLREAVTTDAHEPADAQADGRAFRRYHVPLPVLVRDAGARRGRMTTALIADISLSGLVFLSPRAHAPGTQVEVQIALAGHTFLVGAVVRRTQCVLLPGRRVWRCAVQFLRGEEAARFVPRLARYLHVRSLRD